VTLRVCKRSGLRAGKYCEDNTERGFLESDAPAGRCAACKPAPEHVNRVADRAEPEVVREVQPDYPEELREQGVQGTVTVRYTVDENGKVTGVSVERSSGNDALDDAAVRAIRRYRYRPAQQDGKPRAVQMRRPFVFRLSE
jgi:protein TonB